jgi:hypothetical protein
MRVTSHTLMRLTCPARSTNTVLGRFQTNPPRGRRTTSARSRGVTVTSPTVTGSAGTSGPQAMSKADLMRAFLPVARQPIQPQPGWQAPTRVFRVVAILRSTHWQEGRPRHSA